MGPIQLNLNLPEYDLALQDLVKNTVNPGAFSYVYERVHGYKGFAQSQGQHFEVYGAFDAANRLLGATQITFDQVYWNGKSTSISYSGDTRISVAARGRKLADVLIQAACARTLPVIGAVMGSNHLVLEKKLNDWRKVGVDFKIVGEMKALLFTAKKTTTSRLFQIRSAVEADLPAMYELWQREQLQKNLGRAYADLAEFQKSYHSTAGITLADTLIVTRVKSGAILGFLSVWDQSNIRKIRIHDLSPLAKVITALIRPWISFPREGEELKIAYAFQMALDSNALDSSEVLKALIHAARNLTAQKQFLFFSLGIDARDPLLKTAQKQAITSNSVKMIVANSQPDGRLFHLEVGLG